MRRRKKDVLLVDDDAAFRAMLGLALRRSGFAVTTACDGEDALRRLARKRFDWLVTDLAMVPMDGRELCVRARKSWPALRTVLVSGLGPPKDCQAEHVYAKPVPFDKLVRILRNGAAA